MVNEDRRDGFGGGKDAIKDVIEKRAKSDWGEGYGGSKGDVYKGPSSFEVPANCVTACDAGSCEMKLSLCSLWTATDEIFFAGILKEKGC